MTIRFTIFSILLCFSNYMVCVDIPTGFITEIINNTDKAIHILSDSLGGSYVIKSISLKTQEDFQHLIPSHQRNLIVEPRTSNFISGLKIPIIAASQPDSVSLNEMGEFYCGHYISMNFSLPSTNDTAPIPFIGFRQKGDFWDIRQGEGLHSIYFNSEKYTPYLHFEKIENNATYTIEINQVPSGIFHRKRSQPDRWHLDKDSLKIVVRKNTTIIEDTAAKNVDTLTTAYIKSFSLAPNGLIIALIAFNNLRTEKYLDRFYNSLQKNNSINKIAEIRKSNSSKIEECGISLTFYSSITKDELRDIIDETNGIPKTLDIRQMWLASLK